MERDWNEIISKEQFWEEAEPELKDGWKAYLKERIFTCGKDQMTRNEWLYLVASIHLTTPLASARKCPLNFFIKNNYFSDVL